MKFMYMDESGKYILSQREPIFIFGGLIIDQNRIFEALEAFKKVYGEYRKSLREMVNKNIPKDSDPEPELIRALSRNMADTNSVPVLSKSQRISNMFETFEFHAADMFKPSDNVRKDKVRAENPWKYFPESELPKLMKQLLESVKPYIERIYMFKVRAEQYQEFQNEIGITPTDEQLINDMVNFVLKEYSDWLISEQTTGALVPDRLDKQIRKKFVYVIKEEHLSGPIWTEPITVESHTNAFTQIIDIITYCYRIVSLNDESKISLQAIKRIYLKNIKDFVHEKDLVEHLRMNYTGIH